MANSYVTYTGNGATVQYNVTFPFLSRSHVHAYLAGVETTAFTWISDSLIQFNSAPGNGVAILIARQTPTSPLVDFVDGSTLTEADLDRSTKQTLYVAEEAADKALDALNLDSTKTVWDAESKKIDNVAEPTASDHASTKNYVDVVAAAFAAGTMPDDSVTNAKLANMTQATLKGRASGAGTGDPTDLTPAQGRLVLGLVAALDSFWTAVSVAAARVALGFNAALDALWTAADAAAARTALALGALAMKTTVATADIDNDAVTYAKIQNVSAADRLLGRGNGGGAGDVQELTLGTNLSLSGTTLNVAGGGKLVQRVYATYTTYSSTTGLIPTDDTIPQNTEGAETVTAAITPTNTNNIIRVRAVAVGLSGTAGSWNMALFRDSVANALASQANDMGAGHQTSAALEFEEVAGATDARTYKLRVGNAGVTGGGTFYFNGDASARLHGGVQAHRMIIEEITP